VSFKPTKGTNPAYRSRMAIIRAKFDTRFQNERDISDALRTFLNQIDGGPIDGGRFSTTVDRHGPELRITVRANGAGFANPPPWWRFFSRMRYEDRVTMDAIRNEVLDAESEEREAYRVEMERNEAEERGSTFDLVGTTTRADAERIMHELGITNEMLARAYREPVQPPTPMEAQAPPQYDFEAAYKQTLARLTHEHNLRKTTEEHLKPEKIYRSLGED
jgi:hypothetical protein